MRTVPTYIRGVLVADPTFCSAARDDTLTTATTADWTAGLTVNADNSSMQIEQAGDAWAGEVITLTCFRSGGAGTPGIAAARMSWAGEAGASGTTARGWWPFSVATGWMQLDSDATRDSGASPAIGTPTNAHGIKLLSGKVLIAFQHSTGGTDYIGACRYDPEVGGYDPSFGTYNSGSATYTWSARDAWTWVQQVVSESDTGSSAPATPFLLQLPSGRVLCLFSSTQSYYGGTQYSAVGLAWSDDEGDTWTVEQVDSGARVATTTGTIYALSACYTQGFLTLLLSHDDGGGTSAVMHWLSADLGGSWSLIETTIEAEVAWCAQAIPCDDGSVLAVYNRNVPPATSGSLYASRKTTPAGLFNGAGAAIFPDSASATGVAPGIDRLSACVGDDHTIHVLTVIAETATNYERLRYLRLSQGIADYSGVIQIPYPEMIEEGEPIDYKDATPVGTFGPLTRACLPWGERLLSLFNVAGDETKGQFFGGFSSIDWNGPTWGLYNSGATTARYGVWWDPTYSPNALAGWTVTGGAVGVSPEGAAELDFSGGASTWYAERIGSAGAACVAWARRRQDSGGSLAADQSAIRLRSANGVSDYDITVRFTTTAIRMVDNNNAGATLGTDVTGLTASQTIDVLISLGTTGRAVVWYKEASSQVWIQGPSGLATNDGATPGTNSYTRWGHWSSSTQSSAWLHYGSSIDDAPPYPVGVVEPNSSRRISFGAEVSIWPQYLADGRRYRAASLPARTGEQWALAPSSPYRIENLDPTVDGSPQVVWRSADDQTEQIIGWDTGDADQPLSAAIGLYLRGANFLSITWESWDGAAWAEVADISTVLISGGYALTGRVVAPASSGGSVSVGRDELAGTWCVLTDGATGDIYYAKISANTPGTWTDAADALGIQLRLDGDASVLPASGTIQIIAPEVAHVVSVGTDFLSDKWRVRIPARSYTAAPEVYHEAAKLLIGPYLGFGQPYAWGRTMAMEPIQEIATAPNRRRRVRSLQRRPLRAVDLPFTDPILARDIYSDPATSDPPDTVAMASTGAVLAFASDPRVVEDLLLQAQGARYPVVYLPVLTPPGGTVLQRDLLLYGRVVTGSSVRTAPIGDEGVMEMQTIGTLRIEEEG